MTCSLEYDAGGGTWVPYMQYNDIVHNRQAAAVHLPYNILSNAATFFVSSSNQVEYYDPRTQRWGAPYDCNFPGGAWLDAGLTLIDSSRPGAASTFTTHGLNLTGNGWAESSSLVISGSNSDYHGAVCQNIYGTSGNYLYYADADGVVRRGMGGAQSAWSPSNVAGQPLATAYNTPADLNSRPIMLNRPFQSVAELGYVFSDTPWKNIDFYQPESGYNALLDVFCVNEDYSANAVSAGRVDLNGKQIPVFQALLSGAYREEVPSLSPYIASIGREGTISPDPGLFLG